MERYREDKNGLRKDDTQKSIKYHFYFSFHCPRVVNEIIRCRQEGVWFLHSECVVL